jgi:methylmalonyl-CoA/ethylmalonyl-CoA epimerase
VTGFALSHVGIAVPDLEAAGARLASILGVSPGPVMTNAEQKVRLVQFDLPNARVELVSPLGPEGPVAAFLARNPRGGLHHVALATPDLDAALASLASDGAGVVAPPGTNVWGRRFAFLRPADCAGILFEVEETLPDDTTAA